MTSEHKSSEFRRALAAFPTGVTVVTTMTAAGPLGMTVNSFASVSLDPPLILWSAARDSERFDAFARAEHFAVNVLSSDQSALCDAFAQQGFEAFAGRDFVEGQGRVPLLPGIAAHFECRRETGYDGGDHLVILGRVLGFERFDRRPLLFWDGDIAGL